jgi:hypothetical protein
MKTLATLAALAVAAIAPAAAQAERAVGITGNTRLVSFDTLTPGIASVKTLTGFQAADERVVGLDVRPATGELMAVTVPIGSTTAALIRTYKLDPATATLTFVGSIPGSIPGAGDRPTGIDFQPLVDRVRVVQSNNENFRISPASGGLAADDTNLTYTAPATGPVTGLAYDRNIAPGPPGTVAPAGSKTTAYGIDTGSSRLVVIGGVDGAGPGGPNGGQVTAIGALGVTVVNGSDAGFDISPTGNAFATMSPAAGLSDLYSINLASGAATDIGALPSVVTSLAILAPDNCPDVNGDNQADLDGDGLGDACDPDIDGDGISNAAEAGMGTNPSSGDSDGDGKGDGADACPTLAAATANGCPDTTAPAPVTPPDTAAPKVTITGLTTKFKLAKFLKGVKLKATPNEASSLEVELIVKAKSATVSKAGDLVLASKSFARGTAARSVTLKPNKKLVGGKKKFTATVRVTATDAAGNRALVSKKVSVTK